MASLVVLRRLVHMLQLRAAAADIVPALVDQVCMDVEVLEAKEPTTSAAAEEEEEADIL